ncbi:MAG: DegT/DnrJ/EryC1/StrS family aminotransferase [Verrucomicrobia bacterium]|nr:DegT/DnrJ/EryC1/StrS family aminotransferase [Verrucomicrobiota bacterium]
MRRGRLTTGRPRDHGTTGQQDDQALARRYGLKIIEDAAHCCPAYFRESRKQKVESRNETAGPKTTAVTGSPVQPSAFSLQPQPEWLPVGPAADISCYSFYANKTITTGEGGMACTKNDEYADRMRIMSLHGISKDAWKRFTAEGSWYYEIIAPGYKYNLTDIASAIGIHQLRKADRFHHRRTEIVEAYNRVLKDVEELTLPQTLPDRIHSWHLYVLRLKLDRLKIDRGQFITELQQRGISASVHWLPLHMHPYYRETYGYAPQDLPMACSLYPEIITLPLYPDMSEGELAYVCDSIKEIIAVNLKGRRPVIGNR